MSSSPGMHACVSEISDSGIAAGLLRPLGWVVPVADFLVGWQRGVRERGVGQREARIGKGAALLTMFLSAAWQHQL